MPLRAQPGTTFEIKPSQPRNSRRARTMRTARTSTHKFAATTVKKAGAALMPTKPQTNFIVRRRRNVAVLFNEVWIKGVKMYKSTHAIKTNRLSNTFMSSRKYRNLSEYIRQTSSKMKIKTKKCSNTLLHGLEIRAKPEHVQETCAEQL